MTDEELIEKVARAIHEHLCRRDVMQYLDNNEDCAGIARAILPIIKAERKSDIALIEADRAELVAEIVAELRDEAHMAHIRRPDPDAALQAYAAALSNAADAIEAKFGGRDDK